MLLPVFFKTEKIACLIIGAGDVATNKVERMLEAGCHITIIAPEATGRIRQMVDKSLLKWEQCVYRQGDCSGFDLVVAATSSKKVNIEVSREAQSIHVPVNVVDDPELCTVVFSAVWRDDPLIVAVSTSGKAPFLARDIRNILSTEHNGLGSWVEAGGRLRSVLLESDNMPKINHELMKRFSAIQPTNELQLPSENAVYADWMEWIERNEKRGKSDR
ncbi:MAG: bifunctional precorrin-2 dehydrogenase/sirohydrochlorin ferrochelatase [Calditrichaeota bacterium]|nr:bifunctional precorrin-2 dehydrogenase/sirohydrochlorin ferrochelatase [Calditrichota bacterium]MBT7788714.1 bifunctional precorrin-2 dehydrogenase/sirohydrochlorin ferrochelatase [Calditrichota bacterium]